jgi:NlpC/P60 family putative phage cell wall peptidase
MPTAADVVAEARSWIGTPFHWQASLKGVGCDCKGLIVGVARELGLPEAASLYAAIADYGDVVPVPTLLRGLSETLVRVPEPAPGGIVLMLTGLPRRPQHLGIYTGDHVIHALQRGAQRSKAVTPTPAASAFRAWPLHSAWRFASLET